MSPDLWPIAAIVAVAALVGLRKIGGRRMATVVAQRIQAGAKVVDVRTPEEFRTGAYPGAVNIPLQELGTRMREIPTGVPVVVYCASGGRSALATRMLKQAGYADVVNGGGLCDMPR